MWTLIIVLGIGATIILPFSESGLLAPVAKSSCIDAKLHVVAELRDQGVEVLGAICVSKNGNVP